MNQKRMSSRGSKELIRRLLRPLEHITVAPTHLQEPLLKLIEALPLLIGDDLFECLEEAHAGVHLERSLSRRSGVCCELVPHAPQKTTAPTAPRRPIDRAPCECLVILSSQRRYLSPCAPRPRLTLKDSLSVAKSRFEERPDLKLIFIVTDAWDAQLMGEHQRDFSERLRCEGQVMIPALHHGGLLTPICYL